MFMAILDIQVVATSLPTIQKDCTNGRASAAVYGPHNTT
jgi:hypothetical protein